MVVSLPEGYQDWHGFASEPVNGVVLAACGMSIPPVKMAAPIAPAAD